MGEVELYQSGIPVRDIAKRFGVSRETVYKALRLAGVVSGCGAKYGSGIATAQEIELYQSGIPIGRIAKAFRLSRESIRQRLKKAGVWQAPEPNLLPLQGGICPVCGGSLHSNGKTKAGTQRYRCGSCGYSVSEKSFP